MAGSKKGRAGLRRYVAALRRLDKAYVSLDPAIRPWFSLVETAYIAGNPTIIDREIEMAEGFLKHQSLPPSRDASRAKLAVAAAYDLLEWWDRKAAVTRGGKWAELAKILAGNLAVDLFDHLRAFKRSPGRTVEKVPHPYGILYLMRRREPDIK